jgi:anti-sigma regulatory factor (Ser/Thr protein kinase)
MIGMSPEGEERLVSSGGTPVDQVFDHGSPPIDGAVPSESAQSFAVDLPALSRLRGQVASCGREAGLDQNTGNDLLLAVNELLTNVVRHGGGHGRMWLWHDEEWFYCCVADRGRGLPMAPKKLYEIQPAATAPTGRGLWLIWQFVERVRIQTGPGGTTVTIAFPLAGR